MNDSAPLIYFAYGSNMLSKRLRERVSSAQPIGISQLSGHRLLWHKRSDDGSGKCDIQKTDCEQHMVWGVVYRLNKLEKHQLDQAESLGYGYDQKEIEVLLADGILKAFTYFAKKTDPFLFPYHWYKKLVIAGAQEHSLPIDYLQLLRAVQSVSDPDRLRSAKYEAMLIDS
jgi:gamma-glutamylcyclotransferase